MSESPTDSSYSAPNKRRRSTLDSPTTPGGRTVIMSATPSQEVPPAAPQIPPGHIPKRGARACTACRKGKNRCEGEVRCRSSQSCCRTHWTAPPAGPASSLASSPLLSCRLLVVGAS